MADGERWCPAPRHKTPNPVPVTEFSTDPSKRDGLASWCRDCQNEAARDRRAADPAPRRAQWQRYQKTRRALRPHFTPPW